MNEMKCPSCGGSNLVQIDTNKYQCPYCGTAISATLAPADSDNNEAITENDTDTGEISSTSSLLYIASLVFYVIGAIDFCGMFFDYDFTGVSWSPIAFAGVGYVFDYYAKQKE